MKGWDEKRADIRRNLRWALGEEPAGVTNPGPGSLRKDAKGEILFGSVIARPEATPRMRVMPICPYEGFGDQLFGYLYCPAERMERRGSPPMGSCPWWSTCMNTTTQKVLVPITTSRPSFGIVDRGYAVFSYDMLGFGNRIEEGTRFYQRYPHWSKMGKMVLDVRGAVDAWRTLMRRSRADLRGGVFAGGYGRSLCRGFGRADSRGGFDRRLHADAHQYRGKRHRGDSGVQPFARAVAAAGILPGEEARIPYDFHEILACIAPRPLLVIAPTMDKDAVLEDVKYCVEQAGRCMASMAPRRTFRSSRPWISTDFPTRCARRPTSGCRTERQNRSLRLGPDNHDQRGPCRCCRGVVL